MYNGSCLCGKIRFRITDSIHNIVYCHCSQCRKAQGSAFATNGIVATNEFTFLAGENELTGYEATPGQTKYFCKHCGSPVLSKNIANPQQVRVRLGTIESAISERPSAHIFVSSKADWDEICDDLPQFDRYETGR